MTKTENNIIYTSYLDGWKAGNDSSISGNAVDGKLTDSILNIPDNIDNKPVIRIDKYSFRGITLKSIKLPETLLEIGYSAIDSNSLNLDELILPNSLKKIDVFAFSNNNIKSFTIGENVESIGYGAFSDNYYLESIKVAEGNQYFSSFKGALFNKNKSTLYCVPYLARGFKIPFSVTKLIERSICQKYATTIWIPPSITYIEKDAFFMIENTRTIHILGNIGSVSPGFLSTRCGNLKSIIYHGATIYNETIAFKDGQDVKVYVCKEYESEYFGGKRVNRLGTCYSNYRTCRKTREHVSFLMFLITLMASS